MRGRRLSSDPVARACRIGILLGALPFLAVLWDFGWNPLRTAYADGLNSNFYDLQARALLDGRLDVPGGSLGIEAFVRDGRHYMYFGPFPALLRLPVLVVTERFDGRLTAPSMLLAWLVLALALCRLIPAIRTIIAGDAEAGRFERTLWSLLVAAVLGGSVLVFVASQPWVYNEVYLWTAALSVATVTGLVAVWLEPSRWRVAATVGCASAAMLTRATAGWALALALVVAGGWLFWRGPMGEARSRTPLGLALASGGVLSAAAGASVNWAKFHHVVRFPIELHEWTRVSVHRRLVLLQNDGRIDGPQFFWTDLVAYFRPDGVRFVPYFPFVTLPASPPDAVWGVHLDESFRTGSITALMPLLIVLAIWGLVAVVRPGGPRGVGALRIGIAATVLATGGVMAFGYIAPRYTAEFVPALAVGGVVGVADIGRRLGATPGTAARRTRRGVIAAVALLASYGMIANTATGLAMARRTARGDGLVEFVGLQERLSAITGHPLDDVVRHATDVPDVGPADELLVLGACDALYLGTGETNAPWVVVEVRPHRFEIRVGDEGVGPERITLMSFDGTIRRHLRVEADDRGQVRLAVVGGPPVAGSWVPVARGQAFTVEVEADTARSRYLAAVVTADGGRSTVELPLTEWDRTLRSLPVTAAVAETSELGDGATDMTVTYTPGAPPLLCARLNNDEGRSSRR